LAASGTVGQEDVEAALHLCDDQAFFSHFGLDTLRNCPTRRRSRMPACSARRSCWPGKFRCPVFPAGDDAGQADDDMAPQADESA